MAAPIVKFSLCRLSKHISHILKCTAYTGSYSTQRRCLHETAERTNEPVDDVDIEAESQEYEDEISKLRDVSNLSEYNKARLREQMPPLVTDYQASRKFQRKMYMSLGEKSGLDPRMLFPSDLEIDEMIEDEREWEPKFHDTAQKIRDKKAAEIKAMQDRETLVAANMAKMDGWIADYQKRKQRVKDKESKHEERRANLLDEAYEYYGYKITRKTTEFVEFMEKRVESAKMEKSQAKRKERDETEQRRTEELSKLKTATEKK